MRRLNQINFYYSWRCHIIIHLKSGWLRNLLDGWDIFKTPISKTWSQFGSSYQILHIFPGIPIIPYPHNYQLYNANTSQYIPSISQVYCIPSISKIPSHYIPAKKWFWVQNGWVVIVYSSLVFHYTDVVFFEMGDPRVTIGFNTKMI